jgi:hypothetical protein
MYATSKELGAIKGISEQKVAKLKEIGGCWVLGAAAACAARWVLGAWHTAAYRVAPAVPAVAFLGT